MTAISAPEATLVGVFGGTFDPVHYGHINTAREIAQHIGLAQVRLIPLHAAVHRQQPLASPQQRLQMLQLAVQNEAQLLVDDRELQRAGDSYTVDTLQSLHDDLPEASLCLLVGIDAFAGFADWRQPERILQLAHIIVLQRPGPVPETGARLAQLLQQHGALDADELRRQAAGKILQQKTGQYDISSTDIRTRLRRQLSIEGMTPPAVIDFIEQQHLYR